MQNRRNRAADGDEAKPAGFAYLTFLGKPSFSQLCAEANVHLLYHTYITGVIKDGASISAVYITNKAGTQLINGKMFIDATGDGDISVMAGAAYTKGNPETGLCQAMSLRYILGGVDMPRAGAFLLEESKRTGLGGAGFDKSVHYSFYAGGEAAKDWALTDLLNKGIASGELEESDKAYFQVFGIPGRLDGLAFNCPEFFENTDGTNPEDLIFT